MEEQHERTINLTQLPEESRATITGATVPADAAERELVLRLLELGFVPGERVLVVRAGRSGSDPLAVRLGHTTFALRRREAAFIQVIPEPR
jgi:Fe2+ transport system protein FeoA